jgi:hypothetical protein
VGSEGFGLRVQHKAAGGSGAQKKGLRIAAAALERHGKRSRGADCGGADAQFEASVPTGAVA